MADNDNVTNDESDEGEALPEYTIADLVPKFGDLAGLVLLAWNAHRAWVIAHAAKFGGDSPKYAAWRDSLPIEALTAGMITPADMADDYGEACTVYDVARFCPDANTVASLIFYLTECLSQAKENLAGIYYNARRSTVADAGDAVALRAQVDNYWTSLRSLAETPQLDMAEIRKMFPTVVKVMPKSGAKRVDYDGPTIPQTRQSDGLRKNARLGIWIESEPGSPIVGQVKADDFGGQCQMLGYSIDEFRKAFYPEGLELMTPRIHPDGRKFHLRKVDKT